MRRITRKCVAFLAVLAVGAGLASGGARAETPARTSWIVVVTGTVLQAGQNRIVLQADPMVVAFADRPQRYVSTLSVPVLVDRVWPAGADSFSKDPPNAAVVSDRDRIEIGELKAVSRDDHVVTFTVKRLEGRVPAPGSRVALVVDGILSYSCPSVHCCVTCAHKMRPSGDATR